jgi:sedoheptulokinase
LSCPAGLAEQDPSRLVEAVSQAVQALPADPRRAAAAVGVTGQMHGVLLVDVDGQAVSPLITWQDLRCEQAGFLADLKRRTGYAPNTGFGCATLAHLAAHGQLPTAAVSSGTIADWLVTRLCDRPRCVIDPTNAASWGLFDLAGLRWDMQAVKAAEIPTGLLPEVVPCSTNAGRLCEAMAQRLGTPAGIPVAVSLGDNQASLLATLTQPDVELGLTLGTGGQLSAVMRAGWKVTALGAGARFEHRPYVGGRYVAVASALCGGSAWRWLAGSVENWLASLDVKGPTLDQLYARLDELGLRAAGRLEFHPHFRGERYDGALRGSISGIGIEHLTLGNLARGLARGIVENLVSMLPPEVLEGRSRVVGSGNALRRSRLLRAMAEEVLGADLVMSEQEEEAACGAAKNALLMPLWH